jgi:hypothetical protein
MTVEADLYNALKGLVGNRCFPDFAPLSTVKPYITYTQIGGEALTLLDGSLPDKKHGRFQINVWGDTRASVAALMLQVELAMSQVTVFHARPVSAPSSDYDHDMLIYSAMQDFSVHSAR